jgi:hypothetical protein
MRTGFADHEVVSLGFFLPRGSPGIAAVAHSVAALGHTGTLGGGWFSTDLSL